MGLTRNGPSRRPSQPRPPRDSNPVISGLTPEHNGWGAAVPQTLQWEGTGTVPGLRTWPPASLEPWERGALSSGKVVIPAMIGDLLERVPPMDVPPSEELASEGTRSF